MYFYGIEVGGWFEAKRENKNKEFLKKFERSKFCNFISRIPYTLRMQVYRNKSKCFVRRTKRGQKGTRSEVH